MIKMRMFTSCQDDGLYCYEMTSAEKTAGENTIAVFGIHIYKEGCKHSHSLLESCCIDDISDEVDYVEELLRALAGNGVMPLHLEQLVSEFLCEYPEITSDHIKSL